MWKHHRVLFVLYIDDVKEKVMDSKFTTYWVHSRPGENYVTVQCHSTGKNIKMSSNQTYFLENMCPYPHMRFDYKDRQRRAVETLGIYIFIKSNAIHVSALTNKHQH